MIREQTSIGKQLHQFVATQFLSVGLSTLVECQRCQMSAQITLVHKWCRSDRLWILCRQNLAQISFCYFLCIFYVFILKVKRVSGCNASILLNKWQQNYGKEELWACVFKNVAL